MKISFKFFILFSLIVTANCFAVDLSSQFQNLMNHGIDQDITKLKNYKVLIIPGVLAESFEKDAIQPLKLNVAFSDAFNDQKEILKTKGIDFEFVLFDTENSPTENGKVIVQSILKSDKPVLIYSHSKGGLDTLEGLLHAPEALNKVAGWVSVQSPFYGSPVAEQFRSNGVLRNTTENLFKFFGGTSRGFRALTFKERNPYMEANNVKELILKINQKIKFINYGTIKEDIFGYDTALEFFRDLSDKVSGPNDGVVPITSALLSEHGFDIDYVLEKDVDHLMTMTKYKLINLNFLNSLTDYPRQAHTLSLLNLLVN